MANEEALADLQNIEQNLSTLSMQKQQLAMQQAEIESALKELEHQEKAYKIVGNLLIQTDKKTLVAELNSKHEVVSLRIKTFERQETKLKDRMQQLQGDVLKKLS